MIAAGAGAIEDLKSLLVAVRGLADELLEGFRGDEARAGAGDEKTPRGHQLHGEDVEVVIFLKSFGLKLFITAVDELRGVATLKEVFI